MLVWQIAGARQRMVWARFHGDELIVTAVDADGAHVHQHHRVAQPGGAVVHSDGGSQFRLVVCHARPEGNHIAY
jgi:hypothetical protein